jgi:lipopolysaccharide/colanic/teichoic acid biosynthesis glycosyltransferase
MITRSRPDRTMMTSVKATSAKNNDFKATRTKNSQSTNSARQSNFKLGSKYFDQWFAQGLAQGFAQGFTQGFARGFAKAISDRLLVPIFEIIEAVFAFSFSFLGYRKLGKRVFDFLFALSVLVLFSPVYLFLALLIYLSSPGPILYVQRRIGRHGKAFSCMKFRTMIVDADVALEQLLNQCPASKAEFEDCFKLKDDPRITPIGKWLRMTSLDEFPQFWNVLIGDMSIVGPRPLVQEELPKYGVAINQVLTIRPGITGLWQVSGRNDIPYDQRIQIDSKYVRRHSIWLDLKIIFKTIGVVIFPKGNGAY